MTKMKRILYISQCIPDIYGAGSQKRSEVALSALSEIGDVYFLFAPNLTQKFPLQAYTKFQPVCKDFLDSYDIFKANPSLWSSLYSSKMLTRLMYRAWITAGEVIPISRRQTLDLIHQIRDKFKFDKFDVIYIFQAHVAIFAIDALTELIEKDGAIFVDWDAAERPAANDLYKFKGHGPISKAKAALNDFKLALYERHILNVSTVTLCASSLDLKYFRSKKQFPKTHLIKNCVDVPRTLLPHMKDKSQLNVLFVGLINYWPNRVGLLTFLSEVWPVVKVKFPDIKFDIVGRGVTEDISAYDGKDGITVVGEVASLEPYYEKCDITIAPMQFSVGSSIKILESLAYNRSIVAFETATMRHGLIDGIHVSAAKSTSDFADKLIRLLSNPSLSCLLAENGYQFVLNNFNRQSIIDDTKTVILNALPSQEHRIHQI